LPHEAEAIQFAALFVIVIVVVVVIVIVIRVVVVDRTLVSPSVSVLVSASASASGSRSLGYSLYPSLRTYASLSLFLQSLSLSIFQECAGCNSTVGILVNV
jgi:hypothetical protein